MTYLSPGVYVEEVPSGPRPISAAPTSVVAILGTTRRGPVLEPTRVVGWEEFVRRFGPPTSRSVTGESAYGFFANGGPAAWIVRVDPSTSASWQVSDVGGTPAFGVTAASPGAWGNGLHVAVSEDTSGGAGSFFRATTTGPEVAVTSSGTHTLEVASTAGLRVGDPLALVPVPASGAVPEPVEATVTGLTGTSVSLNATAAATMAPGSTIASAVASGGTTLHLASGRGFHRGDVVVLVHPNGRRSSAVATSASASGSSATLELDAAPGFVPGAAFVQRRHRYVATAAVPGAPTGSPVPRTNLAFSTLTFERARAAPVQADMGASLPGRDRARLTAADGRTATWASNTFGVVGSAPVPPGRVMVEAPVVAVRLADTGLSVTGLEAATVTAQYGFLPDGARVTYSGAGATSVVATRSGGGFTLAPAPDPGDTFTDAEFTLQANADAGITVRCAVKPREGDRLAIDGDFAPVTGVDEVGGDVYVLRFPPATVVSDPAQARFDLFAVENAGAVPHRFALTVDDGVSVEAFPGLSLDPLHPRYYAKDGMVNGVSGLVSVAARAAGAPPVSLAATPFYLSPDQAGADRPATSEDLRQGLARLEEVPEPAMVIHPDATLIQDPLIQAGAVDQVVSHCEDHRLYAVLDAPDLEDQQLLDWRNATVSSTYASVYAPHLRIETLDPDSTARFTTVPPSGFVAGAMARNDRQRGVHQSIGNVEVRAISALSRTYTQRRQDLLNPAGVNLIRAFPGRGQRVWGGRNATDDVTWRYVNVRRLFNMVETSIERATQWVVFEPNTAQTWIRVKVSVENFLDQQWRAGALAGTRPEQAYRVRVGLGETMTETDIDEGRIITEVAIAASKPAEFVIFRVAHKRQSE